MYRKNRKVRFLVYLVFSVLLMNVIAVFPQLNFIVEVKASPEIFSDDVEGGDFGSWDAVINSPQVTSGDAYNGTYKAVFDNQGDRVRKDFITTSTAHFRFYFRIDALPPKAGDEVMLGAMAFWGAGWVTRIYLYNNGTDVVWRMGYYDVWGYHYVNSAQQANPNVDTWICVEIGCKSGVNNGEFQVWIDGSELTDLHLTGMKVTRKINCVIAGTQILSYNAVVCMDSFVVDNSYIGLFTNSPEDPPPEEPPPEEPPPEENTGILGEVEDIAINFACQRKIFYAQGRHWVFYKNGTNIALRTSSDGVIFSDEMLIANVYDTEPLNRDAGFAIWNNETRVAYVSAYFGSIMYRLGQLGVDGTIAWITSKQIAASENGTQLQRPNLGIDKYGHPWIIYNRLNTTDNTRGCYVSKSQWTNGSWSTAPNFPYKLSALSTYAYRGMLLELDEGMYALWYIYNDELRGRLWNYTSQDWENEEVGADNINPKRLNAAVTTSDNTIHMIIAPHSHLGYPISSIYYINRTSAGFGSPVPIGVVDTAPPYRGESITALGNNLYLFWRNTTTTIVSMNRTNGLWGEKFIWKNSESGTKITGMQSFYESVDNKIGVAWVRGTSSPYNLMYEIIELTPTEPPPEPPSQPPPQSPVNRWQMTYDHRDLDHNNADNIVTWKLYNGSQPLSYTEGEYSLLDGNYTLKTYYHEKLINQTHLDTSTHGNSTITISLQMKPHTSIFGGYIAFNNRISSLTIVSQTNENLTFVVEGLSPVLIVTDVPRNCTYIQRNNINQTGWIYAEDSLNYIYIESAEPSKWEYYFPHDSIPEQPPEEPTSRIFSDGVESGDFAVLDAVIGSPQVTSGDAYIGTYKAVFDDRGDRVRKDFATTSTAHFRFYFRIDALPPKAGDEVMLGAMGFWGAGWVMRIYLYNNGTDVVWRMGYYDVWGYHYVNSAQQANPNVDTWICVEIGCKSGVNNGEFQVWIDGSELTDLHLTGMKVTREINCVLAGTQILSYNAVVCMDSFVVDTSYIEP